MDSRETLRIAGRAIRGHELRSALTILGIVIGIASVVAFATFGASVEAEVVGDIETTSASNLYVFPTTDAEEGGFDAALQPVFTEHDVDRLAELDGVRAALPRGVVQVGSISHAGETRTGPQTTATTPASVTNDSLVAGRAFRSGQGEAVADRELAQSFAGNVSPGDPVSITRPGGETQSVTVVGVVDGTRGELPVTQFAGGGRLYLPADPFYETVVESPAAGVRQRAYPQVTLVTDPRRLSETRTAVESYLDGDSDASRLVGADATLVTRTGSDFVDQISDVIDQITRFVTGIAVIALVVGAVGIANVMLVSVTERTREIGIMKAVGARNGDVMQAFLVEAALLGGLGSALGVPLGLAVGYAGTRYADVAFALAPWWMAIAVVVGLLVGVVAGLYPAWRAARVDPIDALRHE